MNRSYRSAISLFLVLVMLFSFFPGSMTAVANAVAPQESAETDPGSGARAIPVRAFTPLQEKNAAATAALLEETGTTGREGDFSFRVLSDGTAAITSYTGKADSVTVPLTLGGADVVALAAKAFGRGVENVTVHGNVIYIEEGALPSGATVSAWQGIYAAAGQYRVKAAKACRGQNRRRRRDVLSRTSGTPTPGKRRCGTSRRTGCPCRT